MFHSMVIGCGTREANLLRESLERLGLPRPKIVEGFDMPVELFGQPGLTLVFLGGARASEALSCEAIRATGVRVVLVGEVPARLAFDCARWGVRAWLDRPEEMNQVVQAMEQALRGPSELERIAAAQLGRRGLREAQQIVRRSMIEHALARTAGNRHAAARLLRVDRRAVQLALKELQDECEHARAGRGDSLPVSEIGRLASERVRRISERVIAWRELPVQTVDWIGAVFRRLSELTDAEPTNLVINLAEAGYPDPDVRQSLQAHFVEARQLNSVSISVGDNEALALAARVVLSEAQGCPVTLHSTYEQAVENASQTARRRSA